MPPVSVLSAPPPPGAAAEPPVPGGIPRLSLATPQEKPAASAKPGLNIKVAAEVAAKAGPKVGGKPVVKPGKPGGVLRKRATLSPVAKAGVAIVVVAIAIGGVFSYRIFFPGKDVQIKLPPVAKPLLKKDDLADKAASDAARLAEAGRALAARKAAEQARLDALAAQAPTPTPASVTVMAPTTLTTDVKVNSTRIEAAPAASAAFRTFVASANIGGVFQGAHSRALINGSIVREGQTVEGGLQITFDRIDSVNKVIYFKDSTGAEVSKSY